MSSTDSRVKKSLLNARVNLIFYFLVLILSFFSRKIFLDTLGAEFIGFTSTLQNLLGFLNFARLPYLLFLDSLLILVSLYKTVLFYLINDL